MGTEPPSRGVGEVLTPCQPTPERRLEPSATTKGSLVARRNSKENQIRRRVLSLRAAREDSRAGGFWTARVTRLACVGTGTGKTQTRVYSFMSPSGSRGVRGTIRGSSYVLTTSAPCLQEHPSPRGLQSGRAALPPDTTPDHSCKSHLPPRHESTCPGGGTRRPSRPWCFLVR